MAQVCVVVFIIIAAVVLSIVLLFTLFQTHFLRKLHNAKYTSYLTNVHISFDFSDIFYPSM